jgi:hypothetical protein
MSCPFQVGTEKSENTVSFTINRITCRGTAQSEDKRNQKRLA